MLNGMVPMTLGDHSRGRKKFPTDGKVAVDDRKVVPDSYGCGQTGVGWVRRPGKSVRVPMVIGTCGR